MWLPVSSPHRVIGVGSNDSTIHKTGKAPTDLASRIRRHRIDIHVQAIETQRAHCLGYPPRRRLADTPRPGRPLPPPTTSDLPRSEIPASLARDTVSDDRPSLDQQTPPARHFANAAPMFPG